MEATKTMDGQDWGLLILLSVLWGGAYFFAGVAVKELPPLTVVLVRVFWPLPPCYRCLGISAIP
ncbi:MAG: EamA domain-containing membrane protein RarD [Gammaproteobacteria bacterium]|jgi:EamA domain-containing membrane protein RarD